MPTQETSYRVVKSFERCEHLLEQGGRVCDYCRIRVTASIEQITDEVMNLFGNWLQKFELRRDGATGLGQKIQDKIEECVNERLQLQGEKCSQCGYHAIWGGVCNRCAWGAANGRVQVAEEQLNEFMTEKRRLTRELDVALNGEEGAAEQASLCDLIHPAQALRAAASKAVQALYREVDEADVIKIRRELAKLLGETRSIDS